MQKVTNKSAGDGALYAVTVQIIVVIIRAKAAGVRVHSLMCP